VTRLVLGGAVALLASLAAPANAGCNHHVPGPCVRTFDECAATRLTYEICGY
jgi:hypothetical protein